MRSQRFFFEKEKKRPVQMTAYVKCTSLLAAVLMIMSAAVFGLLASFKIGRSLLEKVLIYYHVILILKQRVNPI